MMTVSRLDGGCRAPMDGFTACPEWPDPDLHPPISEQPQTPTPAVFARRRKAFWLIIAARLNLQLYSAFSFSRRCTPS